MESAEFTYAPVGATHEGLPDGWMHDDVETVVGVGEGAWEQAVAGLRSWAQFDLGWVVPHDRDVPLTPGATFAFVSRQLGMFSVNVCRVVYAVDESVDGTRRFGFAYGTVGNHVVKGEELFLLEQDPSGTVRFRISKFWRPAHPLVRLAGPLARHVQRRFSTEALARMTREATA